MTRRRRYEHRIAIPILPDYVLMADDVPIPPRALEQIFITVNYPEGYEAEVVEALSRAQPIAHNVIYSPKWDDEPKAVGEDGN